MAIDFLKSAGLTAPFLALPCTLPLLMAAGSTPDGAAPVSGSPPASVPAPRDGADRVGTKLSPDVFSHWVNTDANRPIAGGSVTLYRWWTNT